MAISAFDLFKIGIGPSSSHTVGPMRAARLFAAGLQTQGLLERVARVHCGLHGSLGATGKGHGSDKAVLLGLCGEEPETVPIEAVEPTIAAIRPLVNWVNQCFPGVSTRRVEPWAGLRPMMPDMLPRVGAGRKANVFYNTGHGHLGWTLSAITAHQLAGHVAQWQAQQRHTRVVMPAPAV